MRSLLYASLNASLVGTTVLSPAAAPAADKTVPTFELSKWESDDKLALSDFAGEIVVLDFFAYWCVPCRKASAELEGGIQMYYASKKGNPQGVSVHLLSVNIEQANPVRTDRFIKEAGLGLVVNDVDSKLFEQLGGKGIPFIVVIDGTHATRDQPNYRVVYESEGFKGTKPIRKVIDHITPPKTAAGDGVIEKATGAPVVRQGDLAFDAMLASDIQITSTEIRYGQTHGNTQWRVGYTHGTFAEDYEPYQPFDFLGYPEHLLEQYNGGTALVRQAFGDTLSLLFAGGVYVGFTDYRSVWLANYYKQQFDFVPGYEDPDPRGFNVSTSLRWEYLPTTAFVEASFIFARDQIAPGYEYDPIQQELLHDNDLLDTYAPALRFENIVGKRVRILNEFQLSSTTGRDNRYAYRGAVNLAVGERWVWRAIGGYTQEDPTLKAVYGGLTLEYELATHWLINATGLFYQDTGEIEDSTYLSTAAPGLTTWQGGLGVRYVGAVSSLSLTVAPIIADYEPVEVGTRPFTNLYKDRTWLSIQAAWTVVF